MIVIAALKSPTVVAGFDNVAVVGQPIEQRGRHLCVTEHAWPFAESQVCGDDDRNWTSPLAMPLRRSLWLAPIVMMASSSMFDIEILRSVQRHRAAPPKPHVGDKAGGAGSLERVSSPECLTLPLQSQPNASPFWIMLLLSLVTLAHGITKTRCNGSQANPTSDDVAHSRRYGIKAAIRSLTQACAPLAATVADRRPR